jgi:hypothetical protein
MSSVACRLLHLACCMLECCLLNLACSWLCFAFRIFHRCVLQPPAALAEFPADEALGVMHAATILHNLLVPELGCRRHLPTPDAPVRVHTHACVHACVHESVFVLQGCAADLPCVLRLRRIHGQHCRRNELPVCCIPEGGLQDEGALPTVHHRGLLSPHSLHSYPHFVSSCPTPSFMHRSSACSSAPS